MIDEFTVKRVEKTLTDADCPAIVRPVGEGISFFHPDGEPAVRLHKLRGNSWEVCWWSHRDKWDHIGDFGGEIFDDIDEALTYYPRRPDGYLLVRSRKNRTVNARRANSASATQHS